MRRRFADRLTELDAPLVVLMIYAAFIDGHPWFALGVALGIGLRRRPAGRPQLRNQGVAMKDRSVEV